MEPTIIPEQHQIQHINNILTALTHNLFSIDYSKMGSGKTYTSGYILQYYGFKHCIVVCPSSGVWEDIKQEHKLPIDYILSYDSLRSKKGCQPKHGLLSRVDTKDGAFFYPTQLLKNIVAESCLIILDESHLTKNDSDQFKAARVLCRTVTIPEGDCISRVLFLSATPFDKQEQPTRLLQCAGVISQDKLYFYDKPSFQYELTGIKELIKYCKIKNPEKTLEIVETIEGSLNKENIPVLAYKLYISIIQNCVSFCMPPPIIDVDLDCCNGFYAMLPDESDYYKKSISALNRALRY
jgi:hypothetical protein